MSRVTDPVARLRSALRDMPQAVLGARLRRLRQGQGYSIRELAARAKVSKNSVVRLELGRGSHISTVMQLCDALGVHVERLIGRQAGADLKAHHRIGDEEWFDLATMYGPPIRGRKKPRGMSRKPAKKVKARPTDPPAAICMLRSRLERGRVLPSYLDLTGPSQVRSHPGEEFVYVLRGSACITVGDSDQVLAEGESIAFWGTEPHRYAPAPDSELPVRLLSIRVNERDGTD